MAANPNVQSGYKIVDYDWYYTHWYWLVGHQLAWSTTVMRPPTHPSDHILHFTTPNTHVWSCLIGCEVHTGCENLEPICSLWTSGIRTFDFACGIRPTPQLMVRTVLHEGSERKTKDEMGDHYWLVLDLYLIDDFLDAVFGTYLMKYPMDGEDGWWGQVSPNRFAGWFYLFRVSLMSASNKRCTGLVW